MSALALHEALHRELAMFGAFAELLEAERQALAGADIPALEAILPRKSALLDALRDCANLRMSSLHGAGLPANRDGMQQWVDSSGSPEAAQVWAALLGTATRARELHTGNTALLQTLAENNRQALDMLRQLADPGAVYDAEGRTSANLGPRDLGLA